MKIIGIIPARYASTRFPGKPLALIAGKPLIQHVVEQCQKARSLERGHRGDRRHAHLGGGAGFLPRGNDRGRTMPAERTASRKWPRNAPATRVVNIQGDEPLIDPKVIDAVAGALAGDGNVHRRHAASRTPREWDNPNVVKVVVNAAGRALYFSRRTIPYVRDAASVRRRTVGGVSVFEASRHLRIPARDAVAAGEVPGVAAGTGGEAGTVARAWKTASRSPSSRWITTAWAWTCRRTDAQTGRKQID